MTVATPDDRPVEVARMRAAALTDAVAGLLAAVLLYPFPIMRAALPLPVFVGSIFASAVAAAVLAAALQVLLRGRTIGMYLFGLRFAEEPRGARAVSWGVAWTAGALAGLAAPRILDPATGWAARAGGRRLLRERER